MEEKNQNIEESSKKDLTQEEIEDVQGGNPRYKLSKKGYEEPHYGDWVVELFE